MKPDTAIPATQGMRVFIVEDEVLLALMLTDILDGLGCHLVGSAQTVFQALSQLSDLSSIDAAILDVHIGGEMVFPVADALAERHVPIVFSTGFEPGDLATRYPGSALLSKPYPSETLAAALAGLRSVACASDATSEPLCRRASDLVVRHIIAGSRSDQSEPVR